MLARQITCSGTHVTLLICSLPSIRATGADVKSWSYKVLRYGPDASKLADSEEEHPKAGR